VVRSRAASRTLRTADGFLSYPAISDAGILTGAVPLFVGVGTAFDRGDPATRGEGVTAGNGGGVATVSSGDVE